MSRVTAAVSRAQQNEARDFALSIVRDPVYRTTLVARARAGLLAPAMEVLLFAYAYGKPAERVELGTPGSFARFDSMPEGDLASRARLLAAALDGDTDALASLAREALASTSDAQASLDGANAISDASHAFAHKEDPAA